MLYTKIDRIEFRSNDRMDVYVKFMTGVMEIPVHGFSEGGKFSAERRELILQTAPQEVGVTGFRLGIWDGDLSAWRERVSQVDQNHQTKVIEINGEILPPDPSHRFPRPKGLGKFLKRAPRTPWEKILERMRPLEIHRSRFRGSTRIYQVAIFPGIAVAECPDFGNAIYWVEASRWEEVFLGKYKTEARRLGAEKLNHSGNWVARVIKLVEEGQVLARPA